MIDTNRMQEMSWTTFAERKKQTDLVLIPSGACEVYGPHLPMGSDMLVATKLAERVAERVNAIIGPTVEVGDSSALDDFPGTITIRPDSFANYLKDVVDSLVKWGFKKVLFINGHAGNVAMINHVSHMWREHPEIRLAQIDCWRFIKAQDEGVVESGEVAHGHAGEAGTSVMLYLHPELVDQTRFVDEVPKQKDRFPDVIKYARYATKSQLGTIGYPTMATREKGELLVQRSVDRIVQFLQETWDVSPRK